MNKKRFLGIFCWAVLLVVFQEVTDYVIAGGWMTATKWHQDIVISCWFAFGVFSAQFFSWLFKKFPKTK